jgi:hypothetical protein
MTDLRKSTDEGKGRNILILRLLYSKLGSEKGNKKKNKAIYQFLKKCSDISGLNDCIISTDKDESIQKDCCSGVLVKKFNGLKQYFGKPRLKINRLS